MKRSSQVPLPFGRLPHAVELVGGDALYHLRAVGATQTFCGRRVGDPLGDKRRQPGWGRVPESLRCSQCDRRLKAFRSSGER